MGRCGRDHRRSRTDRRRHHARRGRAGAARSARRRRTRRRSDSRAVRPPRHGHAGDQPAAGDGAARRDAARQPERHGAGLVDRTRTDGDRSAARAAARDDADVRRRDPRSAGGTQRRRRPVPARVESDRPSRIGRRYARPAGLRTMDDGAGSDHHDDSRRSGTNRAAPDGARGKPRRSRGGAGRRRRGAQGGSRPRGVQRGRPEPRSRSSATCFASGT